VVLVDTSVWIAFWRRGSDPGWRAVLEELIEGERVAIVPPIVAELLYGARGERERLVIRDLARGAEVLDCTLDAWLSAGEVGRRWRERGRILSPVDCLLAAVCEQHALALWTLDADFEPLFERGEIRRFAG